MSNRSVGISEYPIDLETAVRITTEKLPSGLITADRKLVDATSCWDAGKQQHVWVFHWLNEKQLAQARLPGHSARGGGHMRVTLTENGNVDYVFSR